MSARLTPLPQRSHPSGVSRPASELAGLRDRVSSQDVMQRVIAGDRAAFNEVYQSTVAVLFSFGRTVLRNPADLEEVICDVYLQAWQSAAQYNVERGSVLTWLMMICRARVLDRYRHNRARSRNIDHDIESTDDATCMQSGPCDLLIALQEGTVVHGAMERLSPVRQHLLALSFFYDLSHDEIAQLTALAVGTVKSHIRRALAALREDLCAARDG